MKQLNFGECLSEMLNNLEISHKRLAKYLNVDPSLVSKWVHGIRIPSYDSDYIKKISDYISENIHNSIQKMKFNNLLDKLDSNNDNKAVGDRVKKILKEVQGFSRERETRVINNNLSTEKSNYFSGLTNYGNSLMKSNTKDINLEKKKNNNNSGGNEIISEDRIITTSKRIFNELYSVLEIALQNENIDKEKPIIIKCKYQDITNDYFKKISELIKKLIYRDWKVILLINIGSNINTILNLFIEVKTFLLEENFNLCYFRNSDNMREKDLIIVPNIGAVESYSIEGYSDDIAICYKDIIAINTLYNYNYNYIKNNSEQLISKYQNSENTFLKLFYEDEFESGNYYSFLNNLNSLTLGSKLHSKYILGQQMSNIEEKKAIECYERRQNNFQLNLKYFKRKEIYTIESIQKYIKEHKYYPEMNNQNYSVYFNTKEIIQHLKNIVYMLNKYKNYEIALINDNKLNSLQFLLKEKDIIICKYTDEVFAIKQSMILEAYYVYFLETWEQIPEINKNKTYVIEWIESQILLLENSLDDTKSLVS